MLSSAVRLPTELIDIIVGLLAADDTDLTSVKGLKACSLVSRDFLDICRRQIFARVILNSVDLSTPPKYYEGAASSFQKLLHRTPELAAYVRQLDINVTFDDDISLVETLKQIQRLKSLTVRQRIDNPGPGNLENRPYWNHHPLQPALLHLLQLPTLTKFSIQGFKNFNVPDLAKCSSLKEFTFGDLSTYGPSDDQPSPSSPLNLRVLDVGLHSINAVAAMNSYQCADGRPFIELTTLKELVIPMPDGDGLDATRTLLNRCQQLQKLCVVLDLDNSDLGLNFDGLFDLIAHTLQTITHLCFRLIIKNRRDDEPFFGLVEELKKMANKNIIQRLQIEYIIETNNFYRGRDWGNLAEALTKVGWPSLGHLTFDFVVSTHDGEHSPYVKAVQQEWEWHYAISPRWAWLVLWFKIRTKRRI